MTVWTCRWVFLFVNAESFFISYDFGFANWCSVSTFLKFLRISVDFFNALKCLAFSNNCFSWIGFDLTADSDEKFFIAACTSIDELSNPKFDISPILLAFVLSKTADLPSINSPSPSFSSLYATLQLSYTFMIGHGSVCTEQLFNYFLGFSAGFI